MHPAFSVIFLTTLIGAGQGLFLALFLAEVYALARALPDQNSTFYSLGSAISVGLLLGGLFASFFHLGHPERAWRSAAMWRTSWLSREVIVLPATAGIISLYGLLHHLGESGTHPGDEGGASGDLTIIVGALGVVMTFMLFVCTGMIYACVKFLQEWASPITIVNFTLLGCASGFTLATAYAAYTAPEFVRLYVVCAAVLMLVAFVARFASLVRNARLRPKSTLQTAIGVRHSKIVQKSQGFMGGSFNTREFFHGASLSLMRSMKWIFLTLIFPAPAAILAAGFSVNSPVLFVVAFLVQYAGLVAERWFFFAQANHPQNLYYQTIG